MELFTDIINNGSDAYRIECLQGKNVLATRPLWEEVFSEDSKAFTDYYFANKALSNTTFICRHLSTEQIVSMVHLTPYEMTIQKTGVPTFYIVGVATKKSHRHRGLMSTLLNKSFEYAARLLCPFVFLMPANPAIYEPFGFSYIYARPQYSVPEIIKRREIYINHLSATGIQVQYLEKETFPKILSALSDFAAETLFAQYDYYLTRSPSYYNTLLSELYAQNGGIYTFSLHNRLEGYFLYTEEESRPFIQELLFSHKLHSYLDSPNYVNSPDNGLFAASMDSLFDNSNAVPYVMSTLFPAPLSECKPIIMAKNLLSGQESTSIPNYSHATSSNITDYVSFLSTHKGFINEIV